MILVIRRLLNNLRTPPGMGFCYRCEAPWTDLLGRDVDGHSTYDGESGGCFPLCERCWQELGNYRKRRPYYLRLMRLWIKNCEGDAAEIAATRRAWEGIDANLRAESDGGPQLVRCQTCSTLTPDEHMGPHCPEHRPDWAGLLGKLGGKE